MVSLDLDQTSSTGTERMKAQLEWVRENGRSGTSNSFFLLWSFMHVHYVDRNDPIKVKLGCGRQGYLMGPCS